MTSKPLHIADKTTSILKFSGADTVSFLQGQLTNDVSALDGTVWQYAGYCNPKGRLLALLKLWKHKDDIYAAINSTIVEPTIKRLRMYIMRSAVTIEHLELASCVGLINDTPSNAFDLNINDSIHTLCFNDRCLAIDLNGDLEGVDSTAWTNANILGGEPTIDANNIELFVPQMINLDLLDGINFKKGCYTGQEIVARMHYLGKLKQRMFLCDIKGQSQAKLASGEKVYADEKSAGHIVSVSNTDKLALAVLRTEHSEKTLATESGSHLVVSEKQPLSIPT